MIAAWIALAAALLASGAAFSAMPGSDAALASVRGACKGCHVPYQVQPAADQVLLSPVPAGEHQEQT